MLCAGCSKKIIRPVSEELLDPMQHGCVCSTISAEDLGHLLLIGDKKLEQILFEREMCIKEGLLKDL